MNRKKAHRLLQLLISEVSRDVSFGDFDKLLAKNKRIGSLCRKIVDAMVKTHDAR